MGLFRKRSNSSTTSTKLKRPSRSGTLPPEVPPIPPAPIQNEAPASTFLGPTNIARRDSQNPNPLPAAQNVGTDGFSTPVSQMSNMTHPSSAAPARSTAPSSLDAASAVSSFKRKEVPNGGPQVQVNGQRISTSTIPDGGFYPIDPARRQSEASVIGSEFDSRPSSMTVTGMNTVNRKPPPPPLRDNPSTSTLPQEWTDRDPSINTRFTHSPTPSESASMQSSVVYPQQPQPERKPHGHPPTNFRPPPPHLQNPNGPRFRSGPPLNAPQYRPNSASHRLPPQQQQQRLQLPPTTPRGSSFRHQQNMLPSLPENRRAQSLTGPRPSPPQQRPSIPPTPGPKHLAVAFTSNHIECNNRHKTLLPMKNYHHPVPCITCRRVPVDGMQYCTFCALRICRECALRLSKEWDGDITRGWGSVTPAAEEFRTSVGSDVKMVAGWGDHSPPIPARNAVNQLVWPSRTNTERVSSLLGVPYRPKTAPAMTHTFQPVEPDTPDLMEQPHFSFESNLDLESGASTISPPSPVTPPAFGNTPIQPQLPLTLANEHRLPLNLSNNKPTSFEMSGYGYPTHSPQIVSDSNPELVQPRPHYPVDPVPILNADTRRSHTFNYIGNNGPLYRTDTQQSGTTVGRVPVRPVTGGSNTKSGIFDSVKSGEKKKSKGLMGLFSKK
ncbi:hypothetical protein ABW19_dt0208175 [Dactylella cylindrospora]|nr:hypothetical protein ABW19_dt0208175 [Dactylella cylindrospora]